MKKVNIYYMIGAFKSDYDFYVDLDTLKVIEEYDYTKLLDIQKKHCLLIPKYTYFQYVQTAKKFLLKNEYKKYKPILDEYIEQDVQLEKINNEVCTNEKMRYMANFHAMCEENNIWDDFFRYEYKVLEEKAIKWCKKNKLEYEMKKVKSIFEGDNVEEEIEKLVDSMLKDKERMDYYLNKYLKEQ